MKSEYQFILSAGEELGKHVGNWIAVVGEEIVASGPNMKKVHKKAKEKYPGKTPFIMKIPKEELMLL